MSKIEMLEQKPPTFHEAPPPAASRPTDTLLERLIAVKLWLEACVDALVSHPDYREDNANAWAAQDIVAQLRNLNEDVANTAVFVAKHRGPECS